MPRTTKPNARVQNTIVNRLKEGNTRHDSALSAGISHTTFYSWLERGRQGEEPFLDFLEAVEKAEAEAMVANVAIIQRAAIDTWQAAAWWLERKRPDDWGRRQRMDIGTSQEQPMKITVQIGGTPTGEE